MAGKAIPLAQFLDGTPGPSGSDELPSAPTAGSGEQVASAKYTVEWNGNGPLPIPDEVVKASEHLTKFNATNPLHTQPPATLEEFKAKVNELVLEYFDSADVMEVIRQLEELKMPRQHDQLVRRAIILSLERTDREREMVAVLVSSLHVRRVVSSSQVFEAFISLLESVTDLMLDCPSADGMLAHFLADAVLDGCLTPTFILEPPPLNVKLSKEAVEVASGVLEDAAKRLRDGTAIAAPSESLSVPLDAVKKNIESLVAEYLQAADVGEVARRLREGHVHLPLRHEVVKRGVRVAIQRGPKECEAISRMISALYGSALPAAEIARGFEALIEEVADLSLDVPLAPRLLGNFVARAVSDDVLAISFVQQALRTGPYKEDDAAYASLQHAKALLAMGHSGARMARVWGPRAVAANASVEEIKAMFGDIVDEFYVSRDRAEAQRALSELAVPAYHHEFGKKLIRRAVEGSATDRQLALDLCVDLTTGTDPVMTKDALALAFDRINFSLADLRLDTPNADAILAELQASATSMGALPS